MIPSVLVTAITDSKSIQQYLKGINLPSKPPKLQPARPPPQVEFEYDLEYDAGA
jgi:hypothetical protein